jgi:hypothetical protein
VRFDLAALTADPSALAMIPLLFPLSALSLLKAAENRPEEPTPADGAPTTGATRPHR